MHDLIIAGCLEEACVPGRTPSADGSTVVTAQAGLVLTDFGLAVLTRYLEHRQQEFSRGEWTTHVLLALRHMAERPIWNSPAGTLWFQGRLVKRFRNDAALQRCVLDALQATAWTGCPDNPLPACNGINRKRQLKHTIKDLNRGQHPRCIRFRGDGRGGICCESPRE